MQLYSALPTTNYNRATTSIDSLKRLRGPKQRLELVRLAAFTAIELGVHVTATAAKFAAAVIQVPVYPLIGGVTPRVALVDAGSHLARSIKLTAALFVAPMLGLAHPEYAVNLYQRFSLIKEPTGRLGSACRLAAAVLAGSALIAAGWAIRSRHFGSAPQPWLRIPLWAGVSGVVGAMGTAAMAVLCYKHQSEEMAGYVPVHKFVDGHILMVSSSSPKQWMNWHSEGSRGFEADVVAVKKNGAIVYAIGREQYTITSSKRTQADHIKTFEHNITFMKEFSDGRFATGYANGEVSLEFNGKIFQLQSKLTGPITAITDSPTGEIAATGTSTDGVRHNVIIWDAALQPRVLHVHNAISCMEFSPDGKLLAMIRDNGTTLLIELSTDRWARQLERQSAGANEVTAIKWLTNEHVLTGYNNGVLRLWDAKNEKLLSERHDHTKSIYDIQIWPNGCVCTHSHDGLKSYFYIQGGARTANLDPPLRDSI